MKRIIAIIAFGAGLSLVHAQEIRESEVPAEVKESLRNQYPDVTKADKWEKDGANYEAEFRKGTQHTKVILDSDGDLVESKMKVDASELPERANTYISQNLKGKTAGEVWKSTDATGNVKYKVKVGDEKYIFSQDGNFIEKKMKDDMQKGKSKDGLQNKEGKTGDDMNKGRKEGVQNKEGQLDDEMNNDRRGKEGIQNKEGNMTDDMDKDRQGTEGIQSKEGRTTDDLNKESQNTEGIQNKEGKRTKDVRTNKEEHHKDVKKTDPKMHESEKDGTKTEDMNMHDSGDLRK